MKKISFEEIGGVAATFYADEDVRRDYVVGISGQETVGLMPDGEPVFGVVQEMGADGLAGVQVSGFAAVPYSGAGMAPGWAELVSDGSGGVRKAGVDETGRMFLVIGTDTAAKTAVVLL